eukprot:GILJ01014041.1.p1 GENE.GILJ01014041.1~~GILJ01014041.1.p1  ORF type:complete len:200 (+),score=22.25 GILJ01014041.1:52-600(+)
MASASFLTGLVTGVVGTGLFAHWLTDKTSVQINSSNRFVQDCDKFIHGSCRDGYNIGRHLDAILTDKFRDELEKPVDPENYQDISDAARLRLGYAHYLNILGSPFIVWSTYASNHIVPYHVFEKYYKKYEDLLGQTEMYSGIIGHLKQSKLNDYRSTMHQVKLSEEVRRCVDLAAQGDVKRV